MPLTLGTTSPAHTAFKSEVSKWEEAGVKVVCVNSPTYVQDALGKENVDGARTCAVLCGQKEMTEAVIDILTASGVPKEKCIMNF